MKLPQQFTRRHRLLLHKSASNCWCTAYRCELGPNAPTIQVQSTTFYIHVRWAAPVHAAIESAYEKHCESVGLTAKLNALYSFHKGRQPKLRAHGCDLWGWWQRCDRKTADELLTLLTSTYQAYRLTKPVDLDAADLFDCVPNEFQ